MRAIRSSPRIPPRGCASFTNAARTTTTATCSTPSGSSDEHQQNSGKERGDQQDRWCNPGRMAKSQVHGGRIEETSHLLAMAKSLAAESLPRQRVRAARSTDFKERWDAPVGGLCLASVAAYCTHDERCSPANAAHRTDLRKEKRKLGLRRHFI